MADTRRRTRRRVMILAAFEAETDRPLRAGELLRLSELGDPELAVAATGVADEGGDLVMLAWPDRVPGATPAATSTS